MKIHNKNLRESGEWEDYTDGADMYSPEFEQQQELTELERERFDSLSLAGQIAEATGTDAEEIQIVLDEAAENDYPNQVVLESLQEILGISEDEMIRTVLPILRSHGFEGDYTADHYDIGNDEEEDIIFESVRKNSKKRVKEATNKYIIKYRDYDADKEIHTDSFTAKDDFDALIKVKQHRIGPIYGLAIIKGNNIYDCYEDEPQNLDEYIEENCKSREQFEKDFEPYIQKTSEEILKEIAPINGDGDDFIFYIQRPDGSYLYKDVDWDWYKDETDDESDWDKFDESTKKNSDPRAVAYKKWIKKFAPKYDVSNEDAFNAGVKACGGKADPEAYSKWIKQFAPKYDVSNEDAFFAGYDIKKHSSEKMSEAYNYVSDNYEHCIDHFCDVHENLEVNYYREYDTEKDADVELYQFFIGDPEDEKYINANLWYSDTEGECYTIDTKDDSFEGHDLDSFCINLEKAYSNLIYKNKKMSESYSANRGSLRKSYAELHPEVKENMREGINSISFSKKDRNNVEATFDTDDGVHVENYDTHRAVGIARDWVRKGYVCKVNGEPVDDPTVFDDCSDEGEMTCTASWRKQESSKVEFLRKKYNEARSSTARRYYLERLKEETSRENTNKGRVKYTIGRITEAYSANRGSATKSYAEMHPEMKENSKTAFLENKLREAKSPKAKEYYLKRLKEERVREASYQKFELPKKATPGDKDYNPDEPGKKPAKRDWTSGKMKSVNGIYGRRAWTTKEPKSK